MGYFAERQELTGADGNPITASKNITVEFVEPEYPQRVKPGPWYLQI